MKSLTICTAIAALAAAMLFSACGVALPAESSVNDPAGAPTIAQAEREAQSPPATATPAGPPPILGDYGYEVEECGAWLRPDGSSFDIAAAIVDDVLAGIIWTEPGLEIVCDDRSSYLFGLARRLPTTEESEEWYAQKLQRQAEWEAEFGSPVKPYTPATPTPTSTPTLPPPISDADFDVCRIWQPIVKQGYHPMMICKDEASYFFGEIRLAG